MANMRARLTLLVPVLILFHHCIPLTGAFPLPVLSDKKYHQSRIPYVSPHAAVRLQDHVREYQLFRLDPECDRRCIGHVMALLNKTKCTDVTLLTTLKIVEARCDGYDDVSAHSIGKYVVRHEKRIRKQYDNVLLPPVSIGETIDDPGAIPEEEDSGLYTDSYSFNHSIERTLQYGNVIWNLDRIDQVSRSLDRKLDLSCFPRLGDGVFLYVLDSGCRTSHIEFKGRMKGIKVGRYTTFEDGHGHGTHVSGTAAGNSYGLCKKCTVFCVKTLDEDNRGSLTDVLNSIDWVIHHKQAHPAAPAVVVLSLGARAETDLLDLAMEDVLNAGIIPVVAAGNGKDDACAWTPARSESVITVAASTMHDLTRWSSNGGRCIDIAAPGQYIESASHISDFESRIMSGTSMAAPHVAGAVALILGENRHLDIKKLKKILALNSIPVFDEKRNRYYSLLQIKHDDCSVYHVEPQYQAGGYFVESEQISAPRLYEAPPPPAPSPFPTQTPTPSSTTQPSTTPSQTASPSVSPTPTPSPTPSQTASPSVSPTPTPSPTPSKTPSPSITPTPTPSPTPSQTASPSVSPTPSSSPTPSQTASPSVSPTPTSSPTPSKTPSPSVSPTPTPSPTPSQTASPSVSPTPTPSPTPSQTASPSVSPTPTPSLTPSQTAAPSVSQTPTSSPTASPSVSPTPASSPTPSQTASPSVSPTTTSSPTPSQTASPSVSPTSTPSPTPSQTALPSVSPTPTPSPTPSQTASPSVSPTPTPSPTPSQTASPSVSPTPTPSPTPSQTASPSVFPTRTPPPTPSQTASPSVSPILSPSPVPLQTPSPSASATPTTSPTPSQAASPPVTASPSLSKTQKTAAEPETLALGASDYPHVSDFFLVSPVATDIVQPSSMLLPVETYESIIASLLPTISPSAEYVDALGASEESPWVSYLVPSPELQPSVLIVPSETYESILTSTLPTISPGV